MQPHPPVRIPEDEVAAILTRAAELDRETRESFDLEAIRTAALEAGISRAAVDRALEEYFDGQPGLEVEAAPDGERVRRPRRFRRWLGRVARPVAHGLVALAIGAFIGGADEEVLTILGFMAWLGFAGVQVWRRRPSRRARGFLASMALVTFGGVLGFGAAGGNEEALVGGLFFAAAVSGYGTLYIKLRLGAILARMKRLADWVAPAT